MRREALYRNRIYAVFVQRVLRCRLVGIRSYVRSCLVPAPIEMPCAATVTVGDAHLWLSRLYQIFVETSVLWLPRSVPPLKTGRSQWRPALRQAASSLARLDPDGKWNGLPNVA